MTSFSSSPWRLSPRAGFGTVPATAAGVFRSRRRSRRLPGLHRAVPSVPLDEHLHRSAARLTMRTRHPACWTVVGGPGGVVPDELLGRQRRRTSESSRTSPRASEVSWRRRSRTPAGPSTTTSDISREGVLLAGGGADQEGGEAAAAQVERPPRTPRGRRGRRRRRGTPPASRFSTRYSTTRPLCMPCERTSRTLPAGLDGQPVALGQLARSASAAARTRRRGRRGGGCARRRPGPCPRRRRRPRRRVRSTRGSSRSNVARPCGGRGVIDPAVGRGPALVAVLPEQVELAAGLRRWRRRPRRARRAPAPAGPAGR